ncbi:MAG TPA: hypothetical protein VF065_01085, partial [Ilumatobacter sp.]
AVTLAVALPAAADASVISTVSADTLTITGDGGADTITLRLTSPTTLDVNGTSFDRATFSKIAIRSGAGDDSVRIVDALTEAVTIESGTGADTVVGGPGRETIASGDDADFVHPGGGDDTVQLGAGDDTAIQGDGFDQLEGQAGKDTLQAIGSDESEEFTLQANGTKVRVSRDTGPATTDGAGVEALDVIAAGGQDLVDAGDLDPTEIQNVRVDLGAADGARDDIAVQGSDERDIASAQAFGDRVHVQGLGPAVVVDNAKASDDRLLMFGRGGSDILDAHTDLGSVVAVTLDGGPGLDALDGSAAADTLRGGPDQDFVGGGKGNDVVDLGDGDDTYSIGPQDGIDLVEGGAGVDALNASGTTADESIDVSGLLSRAVVRFGLANGQANTGGVERFHVNPLAGTDFVTVSDLAGTAATTVDVQLATADLRVDTATVIGSNQAETINLATSGTTQTVSGLAATVNVINPERGQKLTVDARDGADTIDARGLAKDAVQPTLKGGAGKDTIIGSTSDDLISGGTDVDLALMGGGLDTFTWAPGDGNDIVEGQAGTDFLQMNGSGGNDRFDVLPVGGRTRVTRDIENVNVDLGGLERVDILPGPGGDIVRVGDLSGTATDHVDFNLPIARGQIGGDNMADSVLVDGTFGNDTINVNGAGPDVRTSGLAAITTVRGTDPELDRLHVDTKPGVDALTVTGTTNQLIGFTFS